jgi:hypothetical protein
MDRPAWESAFLAELLKLRPHLVDSSGMPNRPAHAIAAANFKPDVDPVAAARQWHHQNPAKPGR